MRLRRRRWLRTLARINFIPAPKFNPVFFIFYLNIGFRASCTFGPFQLIPFSNEEPATQFNQRNTFQNCFFLRITVKFPNNIKEMELQWLDESYVDLTISNKILYFKVWKSTVNLFSLTMLKKECACQSLAIVF